MVLLFYLSGISKRIAGCKSFFHVSFRQSCKKYSEIKTELKLIIEDQLPHQSAGFKSRAKMVLKQLDQYKFLFLKTDISEPSATNTELGFVFVNAENPSPYKDVKSQSIK